jgi:hypothetical protein
VIIDPADVPSFVAQDPNANFLLWDYCSGSGGDQGKGKDAGCSVNFKYGMKRDFNKWLASLGSDGPGEDAVRASALEFESRESAQLNMDNRSSTSQMKWIWMPIAHATKPITQKTYC